MKDPNLKPIYTASRALIIGINDFKYSPPLQYAVSDAEEIRKILINKFDFSPSEITIIKNRDATRANIMSAYLSFGRDGTELNDRLLVFYAGHGFTSTGARGEVGFLVPHDGRVDDLSTLIRWEEFTFNAELIRAKHVLFIMDACYGGLALSRSISAGSMRFLKDMLLRPVRQVLTAGKADQTVADSGGPRPEHSVFTGHLLNALDGQAATDDGVITANGVMAYVYEKVSKDIHSRQTPHFGFFDGDGDFIFKASILSKLEQDEKTDKDILITIPSTQITEEVKEELSLIDTIKEYLSEPKYSIRLHDTAIQHVRRFIVETTSEKFPIASDFSIEEFLNRLERYEVLTKDLKQIVSCIAYWGNVNQSSLMEKVVTRASDNLKPQSGLVIWDSLRWYPMITLFYSAGISALFARNYVYLYNLFMTSTVSNRSTEERSYFILSLGTAIVNIERTNAFKNIPGFEKYYVPRSEYIFKRLQPDLDDLLFLGSEYEPMFDRLEVMLALVHADLRKQKDQGIWGPVGRFGWKYSRERDENNPLKELIKESKEQGEMWPLLKAGFFGGEIGRFFDVATEYEKQIARLGWF